MLSHLNPPQREAVKYLDGPLLVLAGAGSGKTRVITHKIAYLIEECGFPAAHIAAITFTNKAAREMAERAAKLLQGKPGRGLTVTTFHALGMKMLRQEAAHLGYKPRFSIFDAADAAQVLSDIVKTTDKGEIRRVQSRVSLWKNALVSPDAALKAAADDLEHHAAKIYLAYQDTLRAYQAVDFDDLIRLPVELFGAMPDVLEKWRNKLRYLLVDEYQDTNSCQYQLLRQLTGDRGAFTAVGDDDQAIYGWRGADVQNLHTLREDYPRLHVVKLEQNYRSCIRILRVANSLIAHNTKLFDKKLWSDLGLGDPIQVVAAKNEEHEAESVVMRLLAHKFEHRTRFADYAILYRGNHQARIFEQQLRNERIPYQLSGGSSFFDKAEIKDVTAYLRLLVNSDDDPAFIRAVATPKKGIGAQTLEKLGTYAAQRQQSLFAAAFEAGAEAQIGPTPYHALMEFCRFINQLQFRAEREPAGAVIEDLLKAIGYESHLFDSEEPRAAQAKWNNVQEFAAWLTKKGEEDGKNIVELAQTIALLNILENRDNGDVDAVRLSTLHAAKGLEYPHVFLVGVEEGILPHRECIEGGLVE
ncbi:MAG: UvrD-helicase domain-containing protein, partial [Sulfuricella sp.]|nr:UvrD-helicase domain-containing protein [Sulfuricella sp.]